MPRFQVHAKAHHDGAFESQPRFRTPCNELVDGVLYTRRQGWRAEAIEHGQLAAIQIRQAKQPAAVIWLDSGFAKSYGLQFRAMPLPQIAFKSQPATREK